MKFEKITPSVFYSNIKDSYTLFTHCLSFSKVHEELNIDHPYCVVEKDNLSILIFENKEYAKVIKPELRLITNDIVTVYNHVQTSFPTLLHPNLKEVTLRPWGAKEFAIFDQQVCFIIQEWPVK